MNHPRCFSLPRLPCRGLWLGLALLLGLAHAAWAGIPAPYTPMVVRPQPGQTLVEYDLRPAQARARREHKRLYVYLGASDCTFCKRYERFLEKHTDELVSAFAAQYLVVDLRSELSATADKLILRTDRLRLPYTEFQRALGDERSRMLVYPSVWVLDADARPLMQMPAGAGTFETVPEQLEILNLVQ